MLRLMLRSQLAADEHLIKGPARIDPFDPSEATGASNRLGFAFAATTQQLRRKSCLSFWSHVKVLLCVFMMISPPFHDGLLICCG